MPFTLAHPAAVLPLKRLCPRWLSFSGLVIGSVMPDFGYCFANPQWDAYSHTFAGSFIFCLPVGMLFVFGLYLIREPAVERLPGPLREKILTACREPLPGPLMLVVSLLIGTWTHLVWDSFTHPQGWLVKRVPFMRGHIATFMNHEVKVSDLFWAVSSCLGIACICYVYEQWLASNGTRGLSRIAAWRNALLIGLFVLPIEELHHLAHGSKAFVIVGGISMVVVIMIALKFSSMISKKGSGDKISG